MTDTEKRAFLQDLAEKTYPTVDTDYTLSTRGLEDGGLEVTLMDEDDSEWSLDLYYVRHDDLGHLVKAVDRLSPVHENHSPREYLFYAHGHTLAALLLT
jgi:hypothetical protein